jgi:hypothetical protein
MTARYDAVNIFGKPCRNTGVIAIPIAVSAAATSGLVGSTTVTAIRDMFKPHSRSTVTKGDAIAAQSTASVSTTWGLPRLQLTREVWVSGRGCNRRVEQFELCRGEPAEGALPAAPVVCPLDPGHDRQA